LLSILTEIELSEDEIEKFAAILSFCEDYEKLPSYIYQLLLISKKGQRRMILRKVLKFLDRCFDIVSSDVKMAEIFYINTGTIIVHFIFACTQDFSLGNELINIFKLQKMTSISGLIFMIGIVKIHKFMIYCLELLKTEILECVEDKFSVIQWSVHHRYSSISVTIKKILSCIHFGWDDVVSGLLKLAYSLMENDSGNEIGTAILLDIFNVF